MNKTIINLICSALFAMTLASPACADSSLLIRDVKTSPREQYYADSLLIVPTIKLSITENFAAGFMTPLLPFEYVTNVTQAEKSEGTLHSLVKSVDILNSTPGIEFTQSVIDDFARIIGFLLNPIILFTMYMLYATFKKREPVKN